MEENCTRADIQTVEQLGEGKEPGVWLWIATFDPSAGDRRLRALEEAVRRQAESGVVGVIIRSYKGYTRYGGGEEA